MKMKNKMPKLEEVKKTIEKIKIKTRERKNSRINGNIEYRNEFKYYTLFLFMLIIEIFSLVLNIQNSNEVGKEGYNTYILDKSENEKAGQVNADASGIAIYKETISSVYTNVENSVVVEKDNEANNKQSEKSKEKLNYVYSYKYVMPLEGKIIRDYSIDEVVYLPTIDMWKIHEGIDIQANIGDKIIAVEKGVIKDIYKTEFYGVTIEIDHSNGYVSKYCNLKEEITLKAGDSVDKGQEIGAVGLTANGEIKDEPHLHFEMTKNGEYINPKILGIKP